MSIMMANSAARATRNRRLRERTRRAGAATQPRRAPGGDWVRPAGARPIRVAEHRTNGPKLSTAAHPVTQADRRIGVSGLIAAGLLSATVVAALIGIAHWRAGNPTPAPAPTAVIQPHGVPIPAGDAR